MQTSMAFRLYLLAIVGMAVQAQEIFNLEWIATRYAPMGAVVNDTVTFTYNTDHNVHIHPSGNCIDTDSILVGDNTSSPASYTFTEKDIGVVTFACQTEGACTGGMIIQFGVDPFPGAAGPIATADFDANDDLPIISEPEPVASVVETSAGSGFFYSPRVAVAATLCLSMYSIM